MAEVTRIYNERELYGFRFADASLKLLDRNNNQGEENKEEGVPTELNTVVLLDTLHSDAPALTKEQQQSLFTQVCEDYSEIKNKRDLMTAVKNDRHYGALQIKYAYAITCHKAQGGQWEDVYIDQGYITEDMLNEDYIRWLYTAITRATRHVYLVNWPEVQIEE
jgi:superfamily I DNA/RNA helicase